MMPDGSKSGDDCRHRFAAGSNVVIGSNEKMLETIAIVLIILWAVGLVSSYTMGGLIHLFLVIALVVIVLRFIQGRRI